MKRYNWQQPDWPDFQYVLSDIEDHLFAIAEEMGIIKGKLSHFSEKEQLDTMIDIMVEEAVSTSAIEGEKITSPEIRSSLKNELGLNLVKEPVQDKRARGIALLMLDIRRTFNEELKISKLFAWHRMIFSGTQSNTITIGNWRKGEAPMQIVSGHEGRKTVHFEAPPSKRIPVEMRQFVRWYNESAHGGNKVIKYPLIRAAIAHLYFESIHPFDDGNGRIGRAIAEKALSQGFASPLMFSLSRTIESQKKAYYSALNQASFSNEITAWIHYFVTLVFQSQVEAENRMDFVIKKAKFFNQFQCELNERQLKVLKRMFQAGYKGFTGGMSAKKYMAITHVSKATATRDLHYLAAIQALIQTGSGRNVRYELNI